MRACWQLSRQASQQSLQVPTVVFTCCVCVCVDSSTSTSQELDQQQTPATKEPYYKAKEPYEKALL